MLLLNCFLLFFCLLDNVIFSDGQTMPYVVVPVNADGTDNDTPSFSKLNDKFINTIRSCLGSHCYNVKPETSNKHRIGLLGLPNSGASILNTLIEEIQTKAGKKDSSPDIIYSTHVPAYGYGKNHGWSRIIRITRMPIDNTYSILSGNNQDMSYRNKAVFDAQLRQIIRWQCRLSHVAAHTKMLTIYAEDLVVRPVGELEEILTFSDIPLPERSLMFEYGARLKSEMASLLEADLEVRKKYHDVSLDKVLTRAYEDELEGTQMLSQWPCRSFRSDTGRKKDINPEISHIDKLVLKPTDVAPDCNSEHVTCSVPLDKEGA